MSSSETNICIFMSIFLLVFMLMVFIFFNCIKKENFTAPGLTLTMPPSWFPQISAKKYRPREWQTRMYLDRYPFFSVREQEYLTAEESNKLASTNRFWRQ